MRGIFLSALMAVMLAVPSAAYAEQAAAGQGCNPEDLEAVWILTFQRASKSEVCVLSIGKKGKLESLSPCFVEQSGVAPYDLIGKVKVDGTCHVTGAFQPSVGSSFVVLLRLVGGKLLMTGILIDDQNRYLPATLTRFDKL